MQRLNRILSIVVVITVGWITLAGLLVSNEPSPLNALLQNSAFGISVQGLASIFVQLTAVVLAATVLLGVLNLLLVHWRRVRGRAVRWGYSLLLLSAALLVLLIGLLERLKLLNGEPALSLVLLETVQISLESAFAGLLLFTLTYGAYRLLHREVTWTRTLFILVLVLLLVGAIPLHELSFLQAVRAWLLAVPVSAGARGLLLGIALATVVSGVRVLIGQDRSYRE